jgi:outer membrane protein OmpA-like peptidoglycan-associated protein
MHSLSRRFSTFGVLIIVSVITLSGCATKKYVRNQVGTLEPKITEVNNKVTETGERVDAVDRRAQQGITAAAAADTKATAAQAAATTADGKAVAAQTAANTANQGVQAAGTRITTIETRIAGLDNYTAGPPQSVTFKIGSAVLSDEAKATLDMVASGVTGQQNGYMVEVQGFTDSTGSESTNANLSQRRAETVLRYLVAKGIPLFRTSIVGLGEEKPVADNKTRQGREQNRRVEIRVLRNAGARPTN